MIDRIKAAKQQEEQEAANDPKMVVIDKRTPEGRKLGKLIDGMEKRKKERSEAAAVLEEILRARIGSQGPKEQKILSMPLRLMDTVQQLNSVMVAVAEYEKKQPGKQATPYGLEMAESIHALLDHIEETVQMLREKYPEMRT